MSDTTSPSVHLHPISPSSSLSSPDSAPHSEPTSDEQPDLGAFTTVLREWTHLQPPPRIPVQIRSATSSTTPTFQPSVAGSGFQSPAVRSRLSQVSSRSLQSSFTRPPSSSAQPEEGSTVWAHAPIASYLLSATPSNDFDDEGEGEYTPSPPNSLESTSLTVEIISETDIDFNGIALSPYPSGVSPVPVPLEGESQRLDSRETAHPEEEIEIGIVEEASSATSRDFRDQPFTITTSSPPSQTESRSTSMQLQSQARPATTTNSSSSSLISSNVDVIPSVATQSTTTSIFMNALLNRSRNPLPPRTTSDSSFTASDSVSSNISLLSYQIIETPPIDDSASAISTSTGPASMSLKTQRSPPASSSESTSNASLATQRPGQPSQHTIHNPMTSSQYSSAFSGDSPLVNPHSPLPTPNSDHLQVLERYLFRSQDTSWRAAVGNLHIVDDLGTPDQPPSETLLFERSGRSESRPIVDDDDEDIVAERNPAADSTNGRIEDKNSRPQTSHLSGHNNSHDRSGPSTLSYASSVSQPEKHAYRERHSAMEPHNEDEDELNKDDDYSHHYPYSHGLTPRFHGPALTPKGVPPPVEPQLRAPAHKTATGSQSDPFSRFFDQSASSSNGQNSRTHVQHDTSLQNQPLLPVQQNPATLSSLAQPQPQPTNRTNTNQPASSHFRVSYDHSITQPQPTTAAHKSQSQDLQAYPASASNLSQTYPSFSRSRGQPGPSDAYTSKHGYPHSLLGLHALPASFVSPDPEELPSAFDVEDSTNSTRAHDAAGRPAVVPPDASKSNSGTVTAAGLGEATNDRPDILVDQAIPSLGVLDGVLSFIAIERERARTNAAREASSATTVLDDSRDGGSGEDGEGEGAVGEEDWKHIVENEQEHHKRKRRRKRPPRSHASASAQAQTLSTSSGVELAKPKTDSRDGRLLDDSGSAAPNSSPSKKKRSKSASASVSASASAQLLLDDEAFRDPHRNKGKEKEFLVAPSASADKDDKLKPPVTILKRPNELLAKSEVLSEDEARDVQSGAEGVKTPTNPERNERAHLFDDSSASSPLNLTGKKGKRVGRRERDREFRKRDAIKGEMGPKDDGQSLVGGEFGFGFEDDDLNDDQGGESPAEEEDERKGEEEDNDSLSNMALLQPPRRKRDRSRRRKGKDPSYIHEVADVIGASYRSTPGTSGQVKGYDQDEIEDELGDEQSLPEGAASKGHADEDDIFGSKINQTPASEKKKRIRKRPKTIAHAKSVPDLKAGIEQGEKVEVVEAIEGADASINRVATFNIGKTSSNSRDRDVLEMDRNELEMYISASYTANPRSMMGQKMKPQLAPDSKRGRLVTLANQLRELFPEQREELGKVITRITKQDTTQGSKLKKGVSANVDDGTSAEPLRSRPISVPESKRKRSRRGGHVRTGSEGTAFGDLDDDALEEEPGVPFGTRKPDIDEDEEEDIDPRGRPPKRGDVLIHVFIDHSNILIGLLSHLKRHQPPRKNFTKTARPLPAILTKATTSTTIAEKANPALAFAAVKATPARPLPIPSSGNTNGVLDDSKPILISDGVHPIPLPSFATISRSLPTTSALSTYMATRDSGRLSDDSTNHHEKDANSDDHDESTENNEHVSGADSSLIASTKLKEKKVLKHLWHAALTLILERGRPVTRRVVVTSSPLYQPMDAMEQLGYELRVFIRVPDLGDGQDRERHSHKDKNVSGKSNSIGKSAHSSPVSASPFSGVPASVNKARSIGHVRQISGGTSTDSGSGATGSGTASSGRNLHPYYGIAHSSTQARVKFREQGVDELLQLKLHQALAATDDVPDGSTIVLATGDGNMGQFNEDGFLGPVRTALRRGWQVELYAWEDGLSRAWRREFGEGSEWGRRGMFRVIAMEQFAESLVETPLG